MALLGALCHLLYVGVSAALGARLLARGLRSGAVPERWLGLALLGMGGIGYLAMLIPAATGPELHTPLLVALSVVGRVLMDAGMMAMLGFTLAVFRRGERWALALAGVLGALIVASIAGMWSAGDWWGMDVTGVAYWTEVLGAQGAVAWATIEAWRYHRQLRRRAVFGLTEPEIADRAWLWASFGAAQLALMALVTVSTCLYVATGHIYVLLDALIGGCGIASSVVLWLAFWPPEAYRRRWVEAG